MNTKIPTNARALSLIEVILALSILSMISLTILSSVLLSRRLAESNVYENTALTVTQGYMEQIKSMEYSSITDCLITGDPLPCKSVSILAIGPNIEEDDPLIIAVENVKTVAVDLRDDGTGNLYEVVMQYKITPVVTNLEPTLGIQALEIALDYEFLSPETGTPSWRSGSTKFVKSWVPTF